MKSHSLRKVHASGMALTFMWLLSISGCAEKRADSALESREQSQVVYVCRETNQPVLAPLAEVPAPHPQTGRKTLYRALYCDQCDRWYPLPPDDGRNRGLAKLCPKHRLPMSSEGRLP